MIGIHQKCTALTIRSSDIQGLIQDLPPVGKAITQNSDPRKIDEIILDAKNLYLAGISKIIKKLTDKKMHT